MRAHVRRDRARVIDALEVLAHRACSGGTSRSKRCFSISSSIDRRLGGHRRGALAAAEQRGLAEEVAGPLEPAERDAMPSSGPIAWIDDRARHRSRTSRGRTGAGRRCRCPPGAAAPGPCSRTSARSSGDTPPKNGSCARNRRVAGPVTGASPAALCAVDIAPHSLAETDRRLSCMVARHDPAGWSLALRRCARLRVARPRSVDDAVARDGSHGIDPGRDRSVPARRPHRRQAGDPQLAGTRPRLRRLPRRRGRQARAASRGRARNQHAPCDDCHKAEFAKPPGPLCKVCHVAVDPMQRRARRRCRAIPSAARRRRSRRRSRTAPPRRRRMENATGAPRRVHRLPRAQRRAPAIRCCPATRPARAVTSRTPDVKAKLAMDELRGLPSRSATSSSQRGRIFITGDLKFHHATHEKDQAGDQVPCTTCHASVERFGRRARTWRSRRWSAARSATRTPSAARIASA